MLVIDSLANLDTAAAFSLRPSLLNLVHSGNARLWRQKKNQAPPIPQRMATWFLLSTSFFENGKQFLVFSGVEIWYLAQNPA